MSYSPNNNNNQQLTVDEAYKQALDHYNEERFAEADKLCRIILKTLPNYINAFNLLGIIAQRYSRHDLAIKQFQQAIDIDNSRPLLYYNMGISLYKQGRTEEAILAIKYALFKDPNNSQISNYLKSITPKPFSNIKIDIKQEQAKETLQQGIFYHRSCQLDEAVKCYQNTLEIQPENIEALSNVGAALHAKGELELAIFSLQKAISFNPNYAQSYSNLGVIFQEQGKFDLAVANYQKALSIKPFFTEVLENLCNVVHEQKKLDKNLVRVKARVGFFWVGKDITIATNLVKSARLIHNQNIDIFQLTDLNTPDVPGVTNVLRGDLSKDIMLARLQAYQNLKLSDQYTLFCDADCIFINKIELNPQLTP
ncbi:MAG: tetratricopeptide repeat protein, partial [Magnetococcales bacterium]|nr:tetratricopeptide repeat protein [Magnetococcales bacterium]